MTLSEKFVLVSPDGVEFDLKWGFRTVQTFVSIIELRSEVQIFSFDTEF